MPVSGALLPADAEVSLEDLEEETENAVVYWQQLFFDIGRRLAANNLQMAKQHAARKDLADIDVRFVFS